MNQKNINAILGIVVVVLVVGVGYLLVERRQGPSPDTDDRKPYQAVVNTPIAQPGATTEEAPTEKIAPKTTETIDAVGEAARAKVIAVTDDQSFSLKAGDSANITWSVAGGATVYAITLSSLSAAPQATLTVHTENWPIKTFIATKETKEITYAGLVLSIESLTSSGVTMKSQIQQD